MRKKYEITKQKLWIGDKTLYRIRALIDFPGVKKGQEGGFVESEKNLSQKGTCWIGENARVYEDARVSEKAIVEGYAGVCGKAKVSGKAYLTEHAIVCGNARIRGNARITGHALIGGNAKVSKNAKIYGEAGIGGNARIRKIDDYISVGGLGWCERITFFRAKNGEIEVEWPPFWGTIEELREEIKDRCENYRYIQTYMAIIEVAKIYLEK